MRAYDIIMKKRLGQELTRAEIEYLLSGYVQGDIPDYQLAAFLMAVYFQGMTAGETLSLTRVMLESGDRLSLKDIPGIKVDKHSTGGVGDTTTLVLAPLVASAGVPVAKMSGRGLGHTGGTVDKFESIPGFRTDLSVAEMTAAVKSCGVAVVGQTGNLVPADKKLYALRDVTATVDSLPLIASSIMSKKMAAGTDALVLDIKTGDGAFLKDRDQAFDLADTMVEIGEGAGLKTVAVITNMEQPLGLAVGNSLEMQEAILTLKGEGPRDLTELCLVLGGHMLTLAGRAKGPLQGREILQTCISDGSALQKFKEMIVSQGGNANVVDDLTLLPRAGERVPVLSQQGGVVHSIAAEAIGLGAMLLGAGRETKESVIDLAVGIVLKKKVGDTVFPGEELAVLHVNTPAETPKVREAAGITLKAFIIKPESVEKPSLVLGVRGLFHG